MKYANVYVYKVVDGERFYSAPLGSYDGLKFVRVEQPTSVNRVNVVWTATDYELEAEENIKTEVRRYA